MKKLLLILFCVCPIVAFGQTPGNPTQVNNTNYYSFQNYMGAVQGFMLPQRDTNWTPSAPALVYRPADSSLYYWKWNKWQKVGGSMSSNDTSFSLYLLKTDFIDSLNNNRQTITRRNDSLFLTFGGSVSMVPDSTVFPTWYAINDSGYIKKETDPVFTSSPAYTITTLNINNWQTAYNSASTNGDTLILTSITGGVNKIPLLVSQDTTKFRRTGQGYGTIKTGNAKVYGDTLAYSVDTTVVSYPTSVHDTVMSFGNSHNVTVNGSSTISVTGAAQPLSSNPSFTLSANNTQPLWNANQLNGYAIQNSTPTAGQILYFNGSTWAPNTFQPATGITALGMAAGYGMGVSSNTSNPITSYGTFTVAVDTTKVANLRYTDSALVLKKNIADSSAVTGYTTIGGMNDSLNKINGTNGFLYNTTTKTGQVDSSKYSTLNYVNNSVKIDTVQTIAQLEAYNKLPNVNLIYVTDSLRGGLFYRSPTGIPDSGTVFPSNFGGFWLRSWNKSLAMLEWFGAKGDGVTQDAINIQQAFNQGFPEYSSKNKSHIFLINMPLTLLDSEKLYNINFRRANQNETIVTQNITSGTYTNPVINVQNGYAFSIGQYVSLLDTVKNEWINRSAIYKIVGKSPSTVTLGGTITIDSNFIANQTILYTTFSLISCGNYDIINRVNINGNSQNNPYARWVSQSEISTNGNYNLIGETNIDSASGEGIICYLNNNKFDNDNIINSGGNGIHFSGAYNNVVNGAVIINSNLDTLVGHVGGNITWSVQSGYTTVSNSYLENGKHSFGNISDNLSGNLTLTGNTCVNARSGVLDMVGTANYPTPIQNIIFSNNRVYNCGMTSISGGGFPNIAYNNIKIDGNYFFNSPFYLNGVENINFSNNTFIDTISANNSSCLDINNSKKVLFNNNVIDGYYYGIHIFNGSDSSANIIGNTLNSQKMYGILAILATGVNISSNNINNNSNDSTGYVGIEVDSNSIVQNNSLLLDIGSSGIIGSGNNNNIKNNYVRGTVNVGIRLFGNSYKNIVQGNILGGSVPIADYSKYNYVNNNYDLNHNLLSQYNQLSNYLVLNSNSDTINLMNANSTISNILFINNSSLSVNYNKFYLPDATIFKNGVLTIKRQDSLNVVDTIFCQNGQLIDSLSYILLYPKQSATYYSDNKNWWSLTNESNSIINLSNSNLKQTVSTLRNYNLNGGSLTFVDSALLPIIPPFGNDYFSSNLNVLGGYSRYNTHYGSILMGSNGLTDTLNSRLVLTAANLGTLTGAFMSQLKLDTMGLTFSTNSPVTEQFNINKIGVINDPYYKNYTQVDSFLTTDAAGNITLTSIPTELSFIVKNINVATTGTTILIPSNPNKVFIVTKIEIVQTSSTGTAPTISIGYTSPNYSDFFSGTFGMAGQYNTAIPTLAGDVGVPSGDTLYLNVSVAGVGTIAVLIKGFYL